MWNKSSNFYFLQIIHNCLLLPNNEKRITRSLKLKKLLNFELSFFNACFSNILHTYIACSVTSRQKINIAFFLIKIIVLLIVCKPYPIYDILTCHVVCSYLLFLEINGIPVTRFYYMKLQGTPRFIDI